MPATAPSPRITDRASLLHTIGRNYVLRGLGEKDFDAIPYAEHVELRAPFCPGGIYQPLSGRENLRRTWWPPLPELIAGVTVIDTFVNAAQTAVTVEFHCRIKQPACTLRIADRFIVNNDGEIIAQENFFDPREVTNPGWRRGNVSTTIHHLAIASADFARSKAFYAAVLSGLGYGVAMEGEGFAGYIKDGLLVVVRAATAGTSHTHGGCGLHHLAFAVPSRAAVDQFYTDVLLKLPSVEIEDPPVECPEIMAGFYATFFYDPDGIKLEVTYTP